MDSGNKLYISIAVLAVLGGALYFQGKNRKSDEQSHSYAAKAAELPKLEVTEDSLKAVDQIEITLPAKVKGEKGIDGNEATEDKPAETIVLRKQGEERWDLTAPLAAPGNASNAKALLDNVKQLKVVESISNSKETYDTWGVSDQKALHLVLKKGNDTVIDIYFGDDGSRGQMARLAGTDGVFAIKGYSKFSYNRDVKGWRDKGILKFDEKDAQSVTIVNETGTFEFKKDADKWAANFKDKSKGAGKPLADFKPSKVDDLLRAYKGLNAADFGDDKKPSDVGLEAPKSTVTIQLKDGTSHVITVGDTSEGTNRWAKTNSNPGIFSISSWTADWAMGNTSKFQEASASKDKDKAAKKDDDE